MKRLITYYSLFGIFCITNSYAQDSIAVFKLNKIEVVAPKENYSIGVSVQKIDSISMQNFQNSSLADVLSNSSNVFIKNYGPGNLATSSLRGGTAQQTAVFDLWDGTASPACCRIKLPQCVVLFY